MYVYVFLAVNQYANEAWSVILLQLISLNPPSPGLGIAHAHRHGWVNTTTHTHTRIKCLLAGLLTTSQNTNLLSDMHKNITPFLFQLLFYHESSSQGGRFFFISQSVFKCEYLDHYTYFNRNTLDWMLKVSSVVCNILHHFVFPLLNNI